MENLITDIEKQIAQKRILVIGDVMIDAYLFGVVERISPEAPVPIVNLTKRNNRLGGAANVALNILSLGATPILCSVIGADDKGKEFIHMMNDLGLSTEGMVQSKTRITTTKFRIIGNNSQLLRVDEEVIHDLLPDENSELLNKISAILENSKIDSIIFEDYDKGVLTSKFIETIITKANQLHIPITVDPKKRNFNAYSQSTIFKPNLKELKEGTKAEIDFSKPCPLCATLTNGKTCSPIMHIGNHKICDYWYNMQKKEISKTKSAFIKISDDPRITKVGKFIRNTSIDELPQLINVIKGDMSIVGNRPLPVYEAELITRGAMSKRFLAPAGITGLWQVELRGKGGVMSEEERMRLDNEYSDHFIGDNYSFWYDLKLILRTVPALFQKDTV
jgi:rfaE bifunctional protein kinase chain/domain